MHVVPDDDPATTEYLPGTHAIQSANWSFPDVSTYVPDGQLRHVVADDEPSTTEYLPGAHVMQSDTASLPNMYT